MVGVPAVVMNASVNTDISGCIAVVHFSQNGTCLLRVRRFVLDEVLLAQVFSKCLDLPLYHSTPHLTHLSIYS